MLWVQIFDTALMELYPNVLIYESTQNEGFHGSL